MLSDVEMWREFRKGGIVIYPFKPNNTCEEKINDQYYRSNIDGASIYVTASAVGWRFAKSGEEDEDAGQRLNPENDELTIPAKEWVIVCSQETIYLSNLICGTCLNKLSLALKGLEYISAPLKPGCSTRLLMVFHNHTSEPINIKIGSQIVVVTFDRLNTKPSVNGDSHTDRNILMNNMGYDTAIFNGNFSEGNSFLCPHTKERAKELMDGNIKEHRMQIKENKKEYGYIFTGGRIIFTKSLVTRAVVLGASVGIMALSFLPSLSTIAEPLKYIGAVISGGLILAFAKSSLDFRQNEK
jgi:deoxycytidine triphosphate deaminase